MVVKGAVVNQWSQTLRCCPRLRSSFSCGHHQISGAGRQAPLEKHLQPVRADRRTNISDQAGELGDKGGWAEGAMDAAGAHVNIKRSGPGTAEIHCRDSLVIIVEEGRALIFTLAAKLTAEVHGWFPGEIVVCVLAVRNIEFKHAIGNALPSRARAAEDQPMSIPAYLGIRFAELRIDVWTQDPRRFPRGIEAWRR